MAGRHGYGADSRKQAKSKNGIECKYEGCCFPNAEISPRRPLSYWNTCRAAGDDACGWADYNRRDCAKFSIDCAFDGGEDRQEVAEEDYKKSRKACRERSDAGEQGGSGCAIGADAAGICGINRVTADGAAAGKLAHGGGLQGCYCVR
jgi:hypothetical protein